MKRLAYLALVSSLALSPLLLAEEVPADNEGYEVEDVSPSDNSASYNNPAPSQEAETDEYLIPNSPMLRPSNIITIRSIGMGVAPEATISPAQALVLAKRAAITDAYRQLGEKMYGIKLNAKDTVKDAVVKNTTIRTKVHAIIRNAEIQETVYKDGLCQVEMEVKLDGRRWYRILSGY